MAKAKGYVRNAKKPVKQKNPLPTEKFTGVYVLTPSVSRFPLRRRLNVTPFALLPTGGAPDRPFPAVSMQFVNRQAIRSDVV